MFVGMYVVRLMLMLMLMCELLVRICEMLVGLMLMMLIIIRIIILSHAAKSGYVVFGYVIACNVKNSNATR